MKSQEWFLLKCGDTRGGKNTKTNKNYQYSYFNETWMYLDAEVETFIFSLTQNIGNNTLLCRPASFLWNLFLDFQTSSKEIGQETEEDFERRQNKEDVGSEIGKLLN